MSEFMRRVVTGDAIDVHEFRGYLEDFHTELPSTTSRVMGFMHRTDGRTSYDFLADEIALLQPNDVLDVGCGDGALLARLRSCLPGTDLAGIDLVRSELEIARALVPGAKLIRADAAQLPFENASFDVVTSHMVFMLMPNVIEVLSESHRVLRPGGKLIFLIADFSYENAKMRALLGAAMSAIKEKHPNFKPLNPADPRVFAREGIAQLLTAAGFENPGSYSEFEVCANVDAAGAYEAIRQRYYIGSLEPYALAAVEDAIKDQIASSISMCEGVRVVSVGR